MYWPKEVCNLPGRRLMSLILVRRFRSVCVDRFRSLRLAVDEDGGMTTVLVGCICRWSDGDMDTLYY